MSLLARTLLLVCLALTPALAMQAYEQWQLQELTEKATHDEAFRVLALAEGELDRLVEGVRETLTVLSEATAVRTHDAPACQDLLARVAARLPTKQVIHMTDVAGNVWCTSDPQLVGTNLADRRQVRQAIDSGRFVVGEYILRRTTQEPALPFAVPFYAADGQIGGTVMATITTKTLAHILTTQVMPKGSRVILADHAGTILVCEPSICTPGELLAPSLASLLNAPNRGTTRMEEEDGVERTVAFSPLEVGTEDLFLAVGLDNGSLLHQAKATVSAGLWLLAFVLAASLLVATLAYRRLFLLPLVEIRNAVARWRQGDYSARPKAADTAELKGLYGDLAEMARAVGERDEDQRARLEAERAARNATQILGVAMDAAQAGWWEWDLDSGTVRMSEENARLLGAASPDQVKTASDWLPLVHPDDRAMAVENMGGQYVPGERYRFDYRVLDKNGQVRWLAAKSRVLVNRNNRRLVVGINIDITDRKHLEAELTEEKKKAEEANRHKTSFLATASHDLRQPVQSLLLFSSVLAGHTADPQQKALISRLEGSINSLKELLDSLLDISRLEAGTVTPNITEMPLSPLLAQIANEYALRAKEKGLWLKAVDTSLWVACDEALLGRIMRNLVENAIKYTKDGGILLGCRRRDGKACIEVIDTGVGIPESEIKRVFEEFHQLSNPERDRAKGLGLGLAIVQRLSKLLGLRISVASQVGRGTRFTIAVPRVAPAEISVVPKEQARDEFHGCVALIEDEENVREGMAAHLADWGMEVLAGEDDQAVASHLGGKRPSLVIADYRLKGGLTGIEAIHRLVRVMGEEIPAMVLTGETDPHSLDEIRASGYPILHKPLRPAELHREISRLAGSGRARTG